MYEKDMCVYAYICIHHIGPYCMDILYIRTYYITYVHTLLNNNAYFSVCHMNISHFTWQTIVRIPRAYTFTKEKDAESFLRARV